MNTQRPLPVKIATVLLGLLSLASLAAPLLAQAGGPPMFVVAVVVIAGVAGLVAAFGLWGLKRWAMIVTVIVSAVNMVGGAPGIFVAPTTALWVSALVGILLWTLIIGLVVLPTSRRAYV